MAAHQKPDRAGQSRWANFSSASKQPEAIEQNVFSTEGPLQRYLEARRPADGLKSIWDQDFAPLSSQAQAKPIPPPPDPIASSCQDHQNVLDFSLGSLFNLLNGNTEALAQQRVSAPAPDLPRPRPRFDAADRPFAFNPATLKESGTLRIFSRPDARQAN